MNPANELSQTDVHRSVSAQYTAALDRSQQRAKGGSCCGPSCCGSVAQTAGYGAPANAHADAASSSFGCGNPLAFAEVEPGQTVVDLGSGAGYDLLLAADKVGPEGRVIGVDMTDAMIDAARAHASKAGAHQVQVRKGLIEAMPIAADQADWIISNCVINLSPDKPKVFAEMARVLKPGGQFRVSDVVAEALPGWLASNELAYAACIAGAISEPAYLDGLRAAGFTDVKVVSRLVYDAEQIRGIIETDFTDAGLDPKAWDATIATLAGKVASVTVVGRKPQASGCCGSGCC
jgi:arsenite methyltransferase